MQIINLDKEPNINPKFKAFPYQDQAVKTVCDLEYAAIFHEQGLGKSKIAIDVMLYWLEHKYVDTVLFVVKKGLISNWQKEFSAHSHIRPRLITQNKRSNYFAFNSPSRLMITHYEAIKTEKERFKLFLKTRTVAVILDESTKIKNHKSGVSKALFELAPLFHKRIIMTGLPVANRPYDIWSQIYFLDRGMSLGDAFDEFKANTDLDKGLKDSKKRQGAFEDYLSDIFNKISGFTVRETKSSGVIKLPDKIFENIITSWEPKQYDLYRDIRDSMKAIVVKEGIPQEEDAEMILKRLLRLIQIASNPKLVDEKYSEEPGKCPYLYELVLNICRKNEKCIVWTTFTENADQLFVYLKEFNPRKVHGKMPIVDRNCSIDEFIKEKDVKVLIATPGAAKEGLTLTVANHAIFYDRSFSLDDYSQAQDRIHRISQTKKCYVYNLIMEDSVDLWIDALLRAKELSAKLTHGDISKEYFSSQISYSFIDIFKEALNIK
ncbi:MAG: DEAD/DEAH box helicase [Ignavibacteriaceae bacterium]|jgi:SNF2 family DNA or RNA helicase|nr:DEAD/DEAH box helicase [Ignavibacteriaceae bacterium]